MDIEIPLFFGYGNEITDNYLLWLLYYGKKSFATKNFEKEGKIFFFHSSPKKEPLKFLKIDDLYFPDGENE